MVLVDSRVGSKELVKPLQHLGLTVSESTLEFGDVAFQGRGSHNTTLDIGIEFKQLEELIQSLRSGRFVGHQMPGMRATYDHSWLLLEGEWQPDAQGVVCMRGRGGKWKPVKPRMTAAELEKQLLTIQFLGGMNVRYTQRPSDTLRFIATLYRWFTDSAWDSHTSHLAIYHRVPLMAVSDTQHILNSIPGVGWRVSRAAEKKFGSVRRAIRASQKEWAELLTTTDKGQTRRLGGKVAAKIDTILGSF